MRRLANDVQTLYAELVERLAAIDAHRSIGHAVGTFVSKTIKGNVYHYFQHSVPGGETRQIYLGRSTPELRALVRRFEADRPDAESDRADVARLSALLRVGGAAVTDSTSARVIGALAE